MKSFLPKIVGLRIQLLILILIIFIPVSGILLYTGFTQYRQEKKRIRANAKQIIDRFSSEQIRFVQQTNQFLKVLSNIPAIRNNSVEACNQILQSVHADNLQYATIVVAGRDGIINCCAIPLKRPIDVNDRNWFKRIKQSRKFVIDNFLISRSAKKASLPFAYPVLDNEGKLLVAVGAAFNLEAYANIFEAFPLPEHSTILITDREKRILFQSDGTKACLGKPLEDCRGLKAPDSNAGRFEANDMDGIGRIFFYERLFVGQPDNEICLMIGFSKQVIFKDVFHRLILNFIYLTIVLLISVLMAFYGGNRLFITPISWLVQRTKTIQQGNLSRSKTSLKLPGELNTLFVSFESMVEELAQKRIDQAKSEKALSVSEARYKKLFKNAPVALWEEDFTQVFKSFDELKKKGVKKFREFFDENPSMVVSLSQQVQILDVNRETLKLHDALSKDQLLGSLDKIFTENSLEAFKEQLVFLANGVEDVQLEGEVKTLSGSIRHVYLNLALDREREENKILALLSTIDISKRKKAEDSLQKRTSELIERNKELSALYSISKILDTKDIKKIFNKIVKLISKSWQFPSQTSVRIVLGEKEYATRGFKPAELRQFSDILISGKKTGIIEVFYSGKTPVGSKGPFLNEEQLLLDEIAGRLGRFLERQKVEKQLYQSQKMESIGNLAGGIAHDFNNILSSIIGFSDLALEEAGKGSAIENDLKEIHGAGMRARDLVRQILTFARKSEDIIKPVSVHLIATEATKLVRSSIPTTIEIISNIESKKQVMGNPTQIHQIFMNLFTNAAHAMDEKGGTLRIHVADINLKTSILQSGEFIRSGNYIKIEISDTGVGIPDDKIRFIFEPYFTTKDQGEGTGLGLAVVHGIIENCGGKIVVESRLGQGTRFAIYLPCIEAVIEKETLAKITLPTGHERILFVDDEPQIVKLGQRFLSSLGYTVDTCTSSIDAINLFAKHPEVYDIIISDMTMPKLTGFQLAEQMLRIKAGTKFILCTGYSKKLDEARIKQLGIKALMIKPVINEALANVVRNVLDDIDPKKEE